MKNNLTNIILFFIFLLVLFLLMDTTSLINVPDFIDYTFFSLAFIISGIFLHYYIGKDWIKEFKSSLYFIFTLLMITLPLSVIFISIFKVSIIYYNHKKGETSKEKCLVEKVSSGKYRSLSYKFRGKTYSTKLFNYQDYKNCDFDCYIELTLEKKPLGMFYILNIEKTKYKN